MDLAQGPDPAFTSFQIPATDRSERVKAGKALRDRAPHSELARFTVRDDRPHITDFITATHRNRLEWLLGLRVTRMAADPFGTLRGTAGLMAHDITHLPSPRIATTVCGDAHVGNIGFYRSAEGNLVIDLNDFDEAHEGYWEWDVRRLIASIYVCGRVNGASEDTCEGAVRACVEAYRDEVSFLSKQPLLWRAYNHLDIDALHDTITEKSLKDEIKRATASARKRTSDRKLPKITGGEAETLHILEDPPLITRPKEREYAALAEALDSYLATLTPQWRRIVGGYSLVDIAHKVVGVGSVGMRAWVALVRGAHNDDVLFLQLKQATRSALAPYVHGELARHQHQGQRVVEYQQQLQTVSDPLLGWASAGGHQYYVRQWRNMKGSVPLDTMTPEALRDYSRIAGHLLAKGHARTSGASVISGYLGKSDSPVDAFARWAQAAADQTEADHAALTKAIHKGQLPSDPDPNAE